MTYVVIMGKTSHCSCMTKWFRLREILYEAQFWPGCLWKSSSCLWIPAFVVHVIDVIQGKGTIWYRLSSEKSERISINDCTTATWSYVSCSWTEQRATCSNQSAHPVLITSCCIVYSVFDRVRYIIHFIDTQKGLEPPYNPRPLVLAPFEEDQFYNIKEIKFRTYRTKRS